jgi:hypothetical protein
MTMVTRGQVLELTGLSRRQLEWFLKQGVISSAAGGGPGNYHRYDTMRVVALAAGARYLALGSGWDRAAGVVKFLSGLTLERLEAAFAEGRTWPVPATMLLRAAAAEGLPAWLPGMLIAPPADDPELTPAGKALMAKLDLRTVYGAVRRQIAALPADTKRPKGKGRKVRVLSVR